MSDFQKWSRFLWVGLGVLGFALGGWGPWARYPFSGALVEQKRSSTNDVIVPLTWTGFRDLEYHWQRTRDTGRVVVHQVLVSGRSSDWVLASNELSSIQRRPVLVTQKLSPKGVPIRWRWACVGATVGVLAGLMASVRTEKSPLGDTVFQQIVRWLGITCLAGFFGVTIWMFQEHPEPESGWVSVWDRYRRSMPAVAPEKPTITAGPNGDFNLSWESIELGHEIVRAPRPNEAAIDNRRIVTWNGSPYGETNIPAGRWFYAVRALGEGGKSSWVWSGEGWVMPAVAELAIAPHSGSLLRLSWRRPEAMPEDTTIRIEGKAVGGDWVGITNLAKTADSVDLSKRAPSGGAVERWRVALTSTQWGAGAWAEVGMGNGPSVRGRGEVAGGVISLAGVAIEGATRLELLVREGVGGNVRVVGTNIAVTNAVVRLPEVYMTNRQYRLEANHPNGRTVIADWSEPNISSERPYTNSLSQRFVPVPGTEVLFCIWETRVRDFEEFAKENGSVGGDEWRNPGWKQESDSPVVNVSYEDAEKFCEWLTRRERSAGRIGERDVYRLPTDAEWSAAVGPGKYPWGDDWPPKKNDGNYDGEEFGRTKLVIKGYQDGFDKTAPVGRFKKNRYGLYDMGGNVWEFVRGKSEYGEQYRVWRGASWCNDAPVNLESSFRLYVHPQLRFDDHGFRCVLGAEVAR